MLDFCSFNVRGLNSKQTYVKDFLTSNRISLIALLETRVSEQNAAAVSSYIVPQFNWCFNYNNHPNWRIWLGWNNNLWHLSVISCTAQTIHCNVTFLESGFTFCITFVYGFNLMNDRRTLWDNFSQLSASINSPWLLTGDFNSILSLEETS